MTPGPAVEEEGNQRRSQALTMADNCWELFCPGWMTLESSMVPWKEHWTESPGDCVSQGRSWSLSGPSLFVYTMKSLK